MTEIVVTGEAKAAPSMSFDLPQVPLFETLVSDLRKALVPKVVSNQGRREGRVAQPIDFAAAAQLMAAVSIQEVCIMTKRDAIVGLGFETEEEAQARAKKKELEDAAQSMALNGPQKPGEKKPAGPVAKAFPPEPSKDPAAPADPNDPTDPAAAPKPKSKVEEILDPLCEDDFSGLMNKVAEDYCNSGNGYIEVVRNGDDGEILALWHMPASAVHVFNEKDKPFKHFEVDDELASVIKYAQWGDAAAMRARMKIVAGKQITELIHFKQPTARNPSYGLPDWTSCVPWLELAQMVQQCDFDYFQNRAVPDLLVMITGKKVVDSEMVALSNSLRETVGARKRHRSVVANISAPETEVTFERLQSDNRERFSDLWTTIQLSVVSTHRIPPLLAGISLPGKMAAANELPNALIAFQTLFIDQHQKVIEQKLGKTLGSPEAGLGLKATDFKLKKITDAYDMGQVDTMSRMRETTTQAQLEGRKLEDGLKE